MGLVVVAMVVEVWVLGPVAVVVAVAFCASCGSVATITALSLLFKNIDMFRHDESTHNLGPPKGQSLPNMTDL